MSDETIKSLLLMVIDKIDKQEQSIYRQEQLMQVVIDSLTTKKAVAKFLGVHPVTIKNYVKNGTFELDREYFIDKDGEIEFVPSAIVDFKKNRNSKKATKATVKRTLHPGAAKFLGDRLHG